MRITLLLYSHLRAIVRQRQIDLDLPEGATVAQVLAAFVERFPEARPVVYYRGGGLGLRLVLNDNDTTLDQILKNDDQLSLLPPVGGGLW